MYHGGICAGAMGVYERAEEVLVVADYSRIDTPGKLDRTDTRFGGSAVYLHTLLVRKLVRIPTISGLQVL